MRDGSAIAPSRPSLVILLTSLAVMLAACSVLHPLDDFSSGAEDAQSSSDASSSPAVLEAGGRAADDAQQTDAGAETGAVEEPRCSGPQESEPNDEPTTADPLPALTIVCGLFEGDPDVFAFDHGNFGTLEISIDAPEQLEVTALIGGMVYGTHPSGSAIIAPVVNEGTAIVTVNRGKALLGMRVRYELKRTGP